MHNTTFFPGAYKCPPPQQVLAGVLFTLYRMRRGQQAAAASSIRLARPRVLFTGNPRGPTLNGLMDWLGQDVGNDAEWHALGSGPGGAAAADAPGDRGAGSAAGVDGAWRTPADVVVCVSAELAPKVCAAAVAGVQPQLLVVIVHRADTHTKNSKFLALHPQATRIMALAPHVANLSRSGGGRAWASTVARGMQMKLARVAQGNNCSVILSAALFSWADAQLHKAWLAASHLAATC